jgi:hypothetical protein
MPLYEVLLDDWDEIRLTSEPLNVGTLVEIEDVDWLVVGVAKTPEHNLRYLCVRQDAEAVGSESRARRTGARGAVVRSTQERQRAQRLREEQNKRFS